jgi:hypothetical protein
MSREKAKSDEQKLQEAMEQLVYDPLSFVYFAFDWGKGILLGEEGPDTWQRDILNEIGNGSKTIEEALRIAVRSGHGIGKTALIAWIILWFMSTRPHPQVVVTANTALQLSGKTWRELAKWNKLMLHKHWFKWTATKFYHVDHPETWFASAIPWSKERSESFAGTHEAHVLIIFDESSNIADIIWEVAEGAMTTPGAMWIAFGNPTRNSGRFSECFKKFRHRWIMREIDSRSAKKANLKQLEQWITDYGEDSDFVRVRVKGQEPRASSMQLIPSDLVEGAYGRHVIETDYNRQPKIMGIDIARQGDAMSVICKRQGLACLNLLKLRIPDNMQVAAMIAHEINEWEPDAVFIDQGAGVGVIDRLRQLGHDVVEVPFGSKADEDERFANKRMEMWWRVKDWLKAGGVIPADTDLRDDLIGPEYGFHGPKDKMILEKKEDMLSRGLASPDCGDSLALTFAYKIHSQEDRKSSHKRSKKVVYEPFGSLRPTVRKETLELPRMVG